MEKEKLKNLMIEKLSLSRYALNRFCRTKILIPFIVDCTSFLPENSPMNVRCWHLIYDVNKIPVCKVCKINHPKFNNNKWGYLDYCSIKCQCSSSEVIYKRESSLEKRYGKNIKNSFQAKEVKEKIKKTYIEKYGVDHNFKVEDIKQKAKETCIEKYGVSSFTKTEEFKKKYRETINKKWNVDHYSQTDEFKEKCKTVWLKNYGTGHPMQNAEQCQKTLEKIHKFKDYIFPSGRIARVQGYEDKALDLLLSEGVDENDILVNKNEILDEIGNVRYTFKKKERIYFPDFFIKSSKTVIEVKSTWTYDNNGKLKRKDNMLFAKEKACLDSGFYFRVIIM